MTDEEKNIEEYLNNDDIKMQLELTSTIITLLDLLTVKNIITEKEFNETNNKIKKNIKITAKEQIKRELEKRRNKNVKNKRI